MDIDRFNVSSIRINIPYVANHFHCVPRKIDIKNFIVNRHTMDFLLDACFRCVQQLCVVYQIDESHAMKHAMSVLSYTVQSYLYHSNCPELRSQQRVLYAAAVVHDMCDKKYVEEAEGLQAIHDHLHLYFTPEEFNQLCHIITTLSYSTVRIRGYPQLHEWQLAYHIVREADLLASYDIDRCILYGIYREQLPYSEALTRATAMYHNRVMRYIVDGVFVTEYGISKAHELHAKALLDPSRRILDPI